MKFTTEITINKPLNQVLAVFDDPNHLKNWQPELVSYTPISGNPGQPGAKSKLLYNMNGREMQMTETVTVRNLPIEFSGTYETKGMVNTIRNHFNEIDANTTKLIVESEFKFSGIMIVLGTIMFGQLRKQSEIYLQNLKRFVETGIPASAAK